VTATYVLNGWAAESSVWDGCRFPRERIFSYLEQLDGLPERILLDVSDFVLVGFSMGGTAALRLALRFPDRLRALVLVSATARMMEDPATGWKGMSLRRRAALKLGTQIATRGNPSPLFAEANLDRGLDSLQTSDLRAELRAIPADSNLKRIPVAIFQSERDGIVRPSNAAFLKEIFPQASVRLVPGSEHTLPPVISSEIDAAVFNRVQCGCPNAEAAACRVLPCR